MAMQCFAKIAALISLATDFQWVGYGQESIADMGC